MKYKAIIFDWDGTLMDSIAKVVECMQSTAKEFGLAVPCYRYQSVTNVATAT